MLRLITFTYNSIPSVTIWAASTPKGPGVSGFTGNTREAGRVGTVHMVRRWPPFDPGGDSRGQLHPTGVSSEDSGDEDSCCSLILRGHCGPSVSRRNSPDSSNGGFWSHSPVIGSSRWDGRWWRRGRGGGGCDVNMTICSVGNCSLTCKTLEVRGYDLKNISIALVCQHYIIQLTVVHME